MFQFNDDVVGVVVKHGGKEYALIALYKADPSDPTRNVPTLTVYEVSESGSPKATAQTPQLRKVTRETASGSILGVPVVAVLRPATAAQAALKLGEAVAQPAQPAEEAPKPEAPKPEAPKGKGK